MKTILSLIFLMGILPSVFSLNIYDPALVGYWKFNEISGTITDDASSANRNGTITGNVTLNQSGYLGTAFSFNGGYVSVPAGSLTSQFSFGGWFKTSVTHQIDGEDISSPGNPGTSGQCYAFQADYGSTTGRAGLGLSLGTNGISVYEHAAGYMPAVAVYTNNIGTGWNHIMVTYENQTASIYLNGIKVRTGVQSGKIGMAPTQIGNGYYGAFTGSMDEINMWNKALTNSEVLDLYTNGIVPEPSSLFLIGIALLAGFYQRRKTD